MVLDIKEVDIPWPLEALDALPNGRMHHNLSQFGSGKGNVPHILDTGQREPLPLGIELFWRLTEVLRSDEDATVSVIQEHDAQALRRGNCRVGSFFRNDDCHEDSVDALSAKRFIMDVTAGSVSRHVRKALRPIEMCRDAQPRGNHYTNGLRK